MKVVVVGDKDTAIGFSLAGVNEVYTPENDRETKKTIEKLFMESDVGVILMSERLAEDIRGYLDQKKDTMKEVYPVIVELPDKEGPIEDKEDPLKGKIKKAVGIDITSQDR